MLPIMCVWLILLEKTMKRLFKIIYWFSLIFWLLFAIFICALRFYILPYLSKEVEQFSQFLSTQLNTKVVIEKAEPFWNGIEPGMRFQNVYFNHSKKQNEKAVVLNEALVVFSWQSLLRVFKHDLPSFSKLQIHNLNLKIEKDEKGLWIAGFLFSNENKNSNFLDWFFAQPHMRFKNISIAYVENNQKQVFQNVQFSMDNQNDIHRLQLTAESSFAQLLDFRAELNGNWENNFNNNQDSNFYLKINQANLASILKELNLKKIKLKEIENIENKEKNNFELPKEAVFDLNIVGNFSHLYDGHFLIDFNLNHLHFENKNMQSQAKILGAWQKEQFQLYLKNANIKIEQNENFDLQNIAWNHFKDKEHFFVEKINLKTFLKNAKLFSFFSQLPDHIKELDGDGHLENTHLIWIKEEEPENENNQNNQNKKFAFKTYFNQVSVGLPKLLDVKNLNGNFVFTPQSSSFLIDSQNVHLDLKNVFENAPIVLNDVKGLLEWEKNNQKSTVNFKNFSFFNEDVQNAKLNGFYQYDGKTKGFIDLKASIEKAKGNQVWKYLPNVIEKDVRIWLKNAILSGEGYDGKLVLKGNLDDFPFKNKEGVFLIQAKSKNAVLQYAPNWPKIENINADLSFGLGMEIKSQSATILNNKIENATIILPDFTSPDEHIFAEGVAKGKTQEFLNFIEQSEIKEKIDSFTSSIQAKGSGILKLNLDLPVRHLEDSKVNGQFNFENNFFHLLPDFPELSFAKGKIIFTENSVFSPSIDGKWLNGVIKGKFKNQKSNLKIDLESQTPIVELLKMNHSPLNDYLKGNIPWQANITTDGKNFNLNLKSDFKNIISTLPQPLNKKLGEKWSFNLNANNQNAQFVLNNHLKGGLIFKNQIELAIHFLFALNTNEWENIYYNFNQKENNKKNNAIKKSTVNRLFFSTSKLLWNENDFGALSLKMENKENEEKITIENPFLSGDVLIKENKNNRNTKETKAHFKRLVIPQLKLKENKENNNYKNNLKQEFVFKNLPHLELFSDELIWNNQNWGKLQLKAALKEPNLWRIAHFSLENQSDRLKGDGAILDSRLPIAHLRFDFSSENAGNLLNKLGFPGQMADGKALFAGTLNWQNWQNTDFSGLSGNFVFDVHKGSFKKIAPGAGRLLGLLSLQSLVERMRFNFTDVISSGLVFHRVSGDMIIENGVLKTRIPLKINAPAAQIEFTGATQLKEETLNLTIDIRPELGFVTALGLAFVNPIAGAASALASTIGKNPLDKIFYYHYEVGGTWQNPQILKNTEKSAAVLPYNPLKQ